MAMVIKRPLRSSALAGRELTISFSDRDFPVRSTAESLQKE
jgi:hypothetical protein